MLYKIILDIYIYIYIYIKRLFTNIYIYIYIGEKSFDCLYSCKNRENHA